MVAPLTVYIFTVHQWLYFHTSNLCVNHPEGTSFDAKQQKWRTVGLRVAM